MKLLIDTLFTLVTVAYLNAQDLSNKSYTFRFDVDLSRRDTSSQELAKLVGVTSEVKNNLRDS